MITSTLTRNHATWVRAAGNIIDTNTNNPTHWTIGIGRTYINAGAQDYGACVIAYTVSSVVDDISKTRTITLPSFTFQFTGVGSSSGTLYATLSTTAPSTSDWSTFNNGATSGVVSNEVSFNHSTTSFTFTINSGAAISGKTIYLYLYAKANADLYGITLMSAPGNGTLTYSCGHNYVENITPPTCTSGGYTTYTCSICGHSYTGNQTNALGHSYSSTVTKPTCTAQGYTTHVCSRCGDTYKDTYTSALGHSYTCKTINTPTTSATGTLSCTCSRCSDSKTVSLPKLNTTDYTYKVVSAATCTTNGTGRYTWKTTTYGNIYYDVSISAIGHNYTATVIEPTCTAQGYTKHTCSNCGDSYNDTYTDALGHNYVGKVTTEPTYTTEGVRTYTCTRCGASYTESIPKKQGAVYIDNGTKFETYALYIDDGKNWNLYAVYIDDGKDWVLYG